MPDADAWDPLVAADDVAAGQVVSATSGSGQDLVVWRTSAGSPCVMEARCPHNWSHLEAQGAVDGDELVCLTHYWRFDPTGAGWKEAMNGRRDRKADIAVVPCREADGVIAIRSPRPSGA